jgi:hypothetical protein
MIVLERRSDLNLTGHYLYDDRGSRLWHVFWTPKDNRITDGT